MPYKRIVTTNSLIVALLLTQNALSLPPGGTSYLPYSTTVTIGDGTVSIYGDVYQYTSSEYVYTYQILNDSSSIPLSFFSVALPNGADAWGTAVDSDPIAAWVDPVFWTTSGSPPQSVDALFSDTIDTEQLSSILWFVSYDEPTWGLSAIYGTSDQGVPTFAVADVPVPIPDPATLVFLGIGTAAVSSLMRKNKLKE